MNDDAPTPVPYLSAVPCGIPHRILSTGSYSGKDYIALSSAVYISTNKKWTRWPHKLECLAHFLCDARILAKKPSSAGHLHALLFEDGVFELRDYSQGFARKPVVACQIDIPSVRRPLVAIQNLSSAVPVVLYSVDRVRISCIKLDGHPGALPNVIWHCRDGEIFAMQLLKDHKCGFILIAVYNDNISGVWMLEVLVQTPKTLEFQFKHRYVLKFSNYISCQKTQQDDVIILGNTYTHVFRARSHELVTHSHDSELTAKDLVPELNIHHSTIITLSIFNRQGVQLVTELTSRSAIEWRTSGLNLNSGQCDIEYACYMKSDAIIAASPDQGIFHYSTTKDSTKCMKNIEYFGTTYFCGYAVNDQASSLNTIVLGGARTPTLGILERKWSGYSGKILKLKKLHTIKPTNDDYETYVEKIWGYPGKEFWYSTLSGLYHNNNLVRDKDFSRYYLSITGSLLKDVEVNDHKTIQQISFHGKNTKVVEMILKVTHEAEASIISVNDLGATSTHCSIQLRNSSGGSETYSAFYDLDSEHLILLHRLNEKMHIHETNKVMRTFDVPYNWHNISLVPYYRNNILNYHILRLSPLGGAIFHDSNSLGVILKLHVHNFESFNVINLPASQNKVLLMGSNIMYMIDLDDMTYGEVESKLSHKQIIHTGNQSKFIVLDHDNNIFEASCTSHKKLQYKNAFIQLSGLIPVSMSAQVPFRNQVVFGMMDIKRQSPVIILFDYVTLRTISRYNVEGKYPQHSKLVIESLWSNSLDGQQLKFIVTFGDLLLIFQLLDDRITLLEKKALNHVVISVITDIEKSHALLLGPSGKTCFKIYEPVIGNDQRELIQEYMDPRGDDIFQFPREMIPLKPAIINMTMQPSRSFYMLNLSLSKVSTVMEENGLRREYWVKESKARRTKSSACTGTGSITSPLCDVIDPSKLTTSAQSFGSTYWAGFETNNTISILRYSHDSNGKSVWHIRPGETPMFRIRLKQDIISLTPITGKYNGIQLDTNRLRFSKREICRPLFIASCSQGMFYIICEFTKRSVHGMELNCSLVTSTVQ